MDNPYAQVDSSIRKGRMDNTLEQVDSSRLRNVAHQARRSVKFSTDPSSSILKALMSKLATNKTKTTRTSSRSTERSIPKLVFDYGPTTYRNLLLHRKIKIAPFAVVPAAVHATGRYRDHLPIELSGTAHYRCFKHFQKKYPQLRVYYHPITEYNVVSVRLKDCIVVGMLLSNVRYSSVEDITQTYFYKQIDTAIQRMMQYPNLLVKPFRDAVCLMTHNLDMDYDVPWYRTEFPRSVRDVDSLQQLSSRGYSSQQQVVAAPCLVQTNVVKPWKTFLRTVEESPEYEEILKSEFSDSEELKQWLKDK